MKKRFFIALRFIQNDISVRNPSLLFKRTKQGVVFSRKVLTRGVASGIMKLYLKNSF